MPNVKEIKLKPFTRRVPLTPKVCPQCQQPFDGTAQQVYCGRKCYRAAAWAKNGKRYNANRKGGKS